MKNKFLILGVLPSVVLGEQHITELNPITVTGSSIHNNDTSELLPVSVMTAKDIQKTGVRTINDLLRYIPAIDFVDNGNQDGLAQGPGSSFIQLRGLNARNTLVLLDGKRLPLNASQDDDGVGSAVDINLIPLSAIERIEVLKSGSSAVYGSDAVAGVVNLISKQDINNTNFFGNYGNSTHADGEEKNIGFTTGFGDLNTGRQNTFLSFEYFHRDPIYKADRSLTQTVDFRRFGGVDLRSANAPEGNILDSDGNLTGQTYRPCPPEQKTSKGCKYNYNGFPATEIMEAERYNVLLNNTIKFNARTQLNSSFIYSRTDTPIQIHPIPGVLTLPDGEQIRSRFMQGGNRQSDRTIEFFQFKSALNGEAFGQYWHVSAGYGENNSNQLNSNYFLRSQLNQLIADGQIDPTVTTNDQQLINSIKQSFNIQEKSSLAYADFKLEGKLLQMHPAKLDYAAGMQWRQESLSNKPDAVLLTDQLAGGGVVTPFNQSRHVFSGFSELNLKIFSTLNAQAAVRYDSYQAVSNFSPNFAVAYTPNALFRLHANWGQSFLMPSLRQMYAQGNTSSITISGDDCPFINKASGCLVPGSVVSASNGGLKPERATTWSVGMTFKPTSFLDGSLDYWQIDKNGEVIRPDYLTALRNGATYFYNHSDIYINVPNTNLSSSSYQGIDASINLQWSMGTWGSLKFKNNLTYYLDHTQKINPQSEVEIMSGFYGANAIPPWRFMSALTWAVNQWNTSIIVRSTGGFLDTTAYPTQSSPAATNVREVNAYTEADFITTYSGITHLTLTAGVKNFTNAQPPFSSAASQLTSGYAHAPFYDTRGTYFFMTANYQFDY